MSAKPDLWMPFYFGPYLTDTMHLTTEQHGAYFLLLMACWKRGGSLPDDDAQLAAITRLSAAQWRKARAVIAPFWQIRSGAWTQKRLTQELETARAYVKAQSENGKKGGRPKKADDNPDVNPDETQTESQPLPEDKPDETPVPRPLPTPLPGPSPTPEPGKTPRRGAARSPKTPLPDGFSVSERVKAWAVSKGHGRLSEHLERFISTARKHGYRYADWDEAFMEAVRENWAKLAPINGATGNADWWATIDGIKAKATELGIAEPRQHEDWLPYEQAMWLKCAIAVKTGGDKWPWIDPRNGTEERIIAAIRSGEAERREGAV